MKKFPPMRPLVIVLKVFLQQRELNEVICSMSRALTPPPPPPPPLSLPLVMLPAQLRDLRLCRFTRVELGPMPFS